MQKVEAVYRIVTPMFCGGADGQQAELRAQSIKGVLRFWYRACVLPKYKTWQAVQQAERYVFGDSNSGQGIFLLSVVQQNISAEYDENNRDMLQPGCAYLGYGPVGFSKRPGEAKGSNRVNRPYLQKDHTFTVQLFFRPQRENGLEEHKQDLMLALKAWGLLGGMGARARRGFGSVALERLVINGQEHWKMPQTIQEVENAIADFVAKLGELENTLPDYTAFSRHSKLALVAKGNSPLAVLNEIGKEMIRYRSYGVSRNGGARRLPWGEIQDKPLFKSDHDWVHHVLNGRKVERLPDKVVFGLPFSYGTKKVDIGSDIRRASPLLIHIHQAGQQYIGILTLLPAVFYHNARVKVKKKDCGEVAALPAENIDTTYAVIENYMHRFQDAVHITCRQ